MYPFRIEHMYNRLSYEVSDLLGFFSPRVKEVRDCLTPEDGTDRLSLAIGKQIPIKAE